MKTFTKFLRSQLALLKPFISNCSLNSSRKWQEKIGRLMAKPHKDDLSYEDFKINLTNCSMITPKDELSSGVILYLHGGGYVAGGLDYAKGFGSILASKCGIRVLCAAYRLAPENPAPCALDDALDAYGYLLSNGYAPSQILLCGESAGGGLIYSLCLKLKEKGRTMPAGIIAISPWTDLTLSGESYQTNKQADPSMTSERLHYFADTYLYGFVDGHPRVNPDKNDDIKVKKNPLVSPLFGELDRMPPSVIFAGSDEIMLDDARLMHEKLLNSGSESELVVAERMWHGYILYCLKERECDFAKIRKFIKTTVPHQKKLRWMSLDNAAKIFPASRNRHWTNVFRLSATLTEDVDVQALKIALDVTVRRFPSIAVRVRTGMFWYYLEEIPHAPDIMEEKPYPLSRMIFDDIRKCAFRVIVYKKRIAVEFFHALTDGNGGLIFLKTLISEYIYQKYGVKVPFENGVLDRLEEPSADELEDSFFKYAGPKKASRADSDAFKISGKREIDGFKTNTAFILDAAEVAAKAKALGITVTAYITTVFITSVGKIQNDRVKNRKRHKPIKILIPVNLRKIFPSKTLRNFVLYATPGIDPSLGEYSFEEIASIVNHQMKLQITDKNMAAIIATNVGSEKHLVLRATPLFIKNLVMKMVFLAVGERKSCFSFSNLGVVKMPEEFERYVDRLDFVLSVQSNAPYNTSLITYKNKMYLNVIRNIKDPVLEREIYSVLRELGISCRAESNTRSEE